MRARGRLCVDDVDFGVGVRRAQDRRMQGTGRNADVVDIAPAPGEKRQVLDPLDRLPDPALVAYFGQTQHLPGLGVPANRGAVICYRIDASIADGRRLLRDIDVLAVDYLQDCGDAG